MKTATEYQFKKYRLDEIQSFLSELEETDELAAEATGNTRWLVGLVKVRVSRVVTIK